MKIKSKCLSGETQNKYRDMVVSYSMFNLKWMEELEIEPKVIFDVGCNNGGDSIRFSHKWPNAQVYGFEANSEFKEEFFDYIKEKNITFVMTAVTDKDGESIFYPGIFPGNQKSAPWGTFVEHYGKKQNIVKPKKIRTITLHTYCQQHNIGEIDLLHIDTEGCELNIIKGLNELRPKLIFTEQHTQILSGEQINEFHEYMKDINYHLEISCGIDYLYIDKDIKGL